MTLLEQLEGELDRVRKHLARLTRERSVLTEQITRLRTGARADDVCAALELTLGVRIDLYLLNGQDPEHRAAMAPADHGVSRPEQGARRASW